MRVDLHMHSTASDGAYTPEEVVQIALTNNMDVIALTDHDSMSGIMAARAAAAGTKLDVLAGVELSAEDEIADRHILGYLFRLDEDTNLAATCLDNQMGRVRRIEKMVEKLAVLGVNIPLVEVMALADGGSVGRPHLARVMLRHGVVSTLQEAFDRYIGDDCPAYEPHHRLEPARAIAMIHEAGGVAVLAHPGHYENYRAIIDELLPYSLDGIEVYYPDHTPEIVADLRVIARQRNLVMTVGSDFHRREGDGSARIGSVYFPPEQDIVGPLRERAS